MLVNSGFHAYTVDLPGYGRSEGKVDDALRGLFLEVRMGLLLLFFAFFLHMLCALLVPLVMDTQCTAMLQATDSHNDYDV